MRVPLSWLREHVEIPEGTTTDEVFAALVSVGFEEEELVSFEVTGPVVVGRVLSLEPEPQKNGKTINWCQVDVGEANGGVRGIVCGAHNFVAGDKVVVTLPGAVLPGPFPIASRKTYGHVSDGMIASAKELGLGDDHDGILRLADLGVDAEIGSDAIPLLGLDDVAVDVNVTPDRGYALSIRGIAREYGLATGATFADPADRADIATGEGFSVTIDDAAPIRGRVGASGFVTRVVRGVDPSLPTPPWMVARLALAGVRSLGLLIDITNYVMIELGQPIHGYDLDALTGGITVRRARQGEKLTTLDGQERTLFAEDLLITDGSGPIGLAGVMGGTTTEMGEKTTSVLIEAATFDQVSIARTARRHKLPSEASRRFERGVDPAIAPVAAQRVVDLMVELADGTADALGSSIVSDLVRAPIALPAAFVPGIIGVDYAPERIRESLELIGCAVADAEDGWRVTPPTWRGDLIDKWTLAEEVVRVNDVDKVPSILPTPPSGRGYTPDQQARRRVSNALAAAGFVETPSFPFVPEEQNDLHGSATGQALPSVKLANAISAQAAFLRRTLVPGLLQTAHRNISRGLSDLALFEVGSVFLPEPGVVYGTETVPPLAQRPAETVLAELDAAIPPQSRFLAILLAGNVTAKQPGRAAEAAGLEVALDAIRTVGVAAGVEIDVAQGERAALHPGRTGVLSVETTAGGRLEVGYVGELLPKVADDADVPARTVVGELDLDLLLEAAGERVVVASLSTFPAATQDVSLVVDAALPAAELRAALTEGAGPLLEHVRLVDDYRGSGIDEGKKSLTFALRFRAPDRTLTAVEATEAKLAGVAVARSRFDAHIRE